MTARHLRIEGRVQGVFYRQWTTDTARNLGLDGWVRNRADGSVEAVFAGEEAAVEAMIDACRDGPIRAVVTSISVKEWVEPVETGFHKKPTL